MPQHKLIIRPRKVTLHMPEDVMTRLDLYLISLSQGKVPQGAYQRFFVERFEEFFGKLKVVPAGTAEVTEEHDAKVRAEAAAKHFGQSS